MSEQTREQARREFLGRVNRACALFGYGIKSVVEYGPYLIGLEDAKGEWDVYFDIRAWGLNSPKNVSFWGNVSPGGIDAYSIGVLRGVGWRPAPKTQDELLGFITRNLRSLRPDIKLHDHSLAIFPQAKSPGIAS